MNVLFAVPLFALLGLVGCSVSIIPNVPADYQLNADNSMTASTNGLTVTAGVQDLEVAPYRMVNNITSFLVSIDNQTIGEVETPLSMFLLVDNDGRQYSPIAPGDIQAIIKKDSSYLIPYPYVGYYYLEDKEKSAQYETFDSSLPYYSENYPQDIFTQALPAGMIVPGAKIVGLVYFVADLTTMTGFELRLYRPTNPRTEKPDFSFPFSVAK